MPAPARCAAAAGCILEWADERRLALLNAVCLVLFVGPIMAPLLLALGAPGPASLLYRSFHLVCHQWAFRSFFILGPHTTLSRDQLVVRGVDPHTFVGDAQSGWKMAVCEPNLAIFLGLLLFGLFYGSRRELRPVSLAVFLMMIAPIALDSSRQLFGWRESAWERGVATRLLFGAPSPHRARAR